MLDTILNEEAFKRFVAEMRTSITNYGFEDPNLECMFSFTNFSTTLWSAALQGTALTHFDT